ncbi:hypothetical protein BDV23DRAFT_176984 [Aspergillus alliaceus]|uniref:Polyketide synthase n=1 Tax=Petromyces alliaceus TaxID=209559 RepID=A0A5N7BSA3_PETAA|nr:hypothetical protein BDV23DRAFT_176984 [Aspergillus alliaceus]
MKNTQTVIVFGDQTTDFRAGLRQLLGVENNGLLTSFLEWVYFKLRQEIGHLSFTEQQLFPRFTSIIDLLARYEETDGHPVLESILVCIYHIAAFIQYHTDSGREYPSPSNAHVVGLCTGLLAAAAVCASRSLGDLIPAAVEVVLVAMRIGLRTLRAGQLIEPSAKMSGQWSVLLPYLRHEDAGGIVQDYMSGNKRSSGSKIYISAVSSNGVTVSGPPTEIECFLQRTISIQNPARLQVHAPYHAPHLFDGIDVEDIVTGQVPESLAARAPVLSFVSSITGRPAEAADFVTLLKTAVQGIMLEQLRVDKIFENLPCTSLIRDKPCNILTFGTSIGPSLSASLTNVDSNLVETTCIHDSRDKPRHTASRSKIAIIGLSGRCPDAPDHDQFWDLLKKGLDVHRQVPPDRWGMDHYDPTGKQKNTSRTQRGCWIDEPGMFDARFFNMSPREAAQSDPGQRLALQTAYEALEMARIVPDATPSTQRDRFGVFYGMTSDDYREVNSGQDIDTYFIPGGNRAFTPGKINYYFKFSGPSFTVDTACSSSLSAIHMACNSLWRNDCDTALAGGTNIMTNPDNFAGLDKGHFLSTKGNCNTFDDEADGYCRADAVGTVVLKRLDDALADHDPILGVILGAYTNHSAESVSITRPHAGAQQFIFQKLLNEYGVHPHDISYVEMHGTGTQAGDAAEMTSVLSVLAPDYKRSKDRPLYLGSVKSNVGHAESASGVTSLIKVLLMLENDLIPPHCGIKTRINHTFPTDLDRRQVHTALEPTPWNRPRKGLRRTFVNNFSAAGGNTAILLEERPTPVQANWPADVRSSHPVTISAKSRTALQNNLHSLNKYIGQSSNGKVDGFLGKLSYTLTARRVHHPYRVAVSGSNVPEILSLLEKTDCYSIQPVSSTPANVGFAFTGQGAQYAGMGRQLFANLSGFRSDILMFNNMVKWEGLPSILPLVDGTCASVAEIEPLVLQVGATCLQLALLRFWESLGIRPKFVIGHSLGEYAALTAAGVLTPSDTIHLVCARALLLQRHCQVGTHSMLAVNAAREALAPYVKATPVEVACLNGPQETVISGRESDVDTLAVLLQDNDIKCTKLQVPYAFHSSQVDPILDSLEEAGRGIKFHEPSVSVISSLLGEVITSEGTFGPGYLRRHCREEVNFCGALQAAERSQVIPEGTLWIEVGTHPVCSAMIKSTLGVKSNTLPTLNRKEDTWKTLSRTLSQLYTAGVDLSWREYHRDFNASQRVLQLPVYNWDNKNYWIHYQHSWTLTKGNPSGFSHQTSATQSEPRFSTSSVQLISNLAHPELQRVCKGHLVNEVPLCPSSLFADIGETMGKYLLQTFKPVLQGDVVDICNMVVDKPLIYQGIETQLFRASVTADWSSQSAKMSIYSVNQDGTKTIEHATCLLHFGETASWKNEWHRVLHHIERSILHLETGVKEGRNHHLRTGMAYRLFAALVDYQPDFKGIQDVILDSESYEATATVKYQTPAHGFQRNPIWIDSCGQLAGFTLNANDATSKDQVYINHGWESVRFTADFSSDKVYRTYVRMLPADRNRFSGDLVVLDGDEIVAVYSAVKFQGIPRRLLEAALPPPRVEKWPGRARTASPASKVIPTLRTVKARTSRSSEDSLSLILRIFSEEVGILYEELVDNINFADYGVDSLLSLTITGRCREELDIELPSTVFLDAPTLGQFRSIFMGKLGSSPTVLSSHSSGSHDHFDESGSDSSTESLKQTMSPAIPSSEDMVGVCEILADEIGLSLDELRSTESLTELGMDSLLSLTVISRVREELRIDLPNNFFIAHNSLDTIYKAMDPHSTSGGTSMSKAATHNTVMGPSARQEVKIPPATSILLQGSPKVATRFLFLFPDGSGAATSYSSLPQVSPDICVYGLNCPYMENPEDMTCRLEELTSPYVTEIRRRQPKGPYNLAGWSAGGICAYDAVRWIQAVGEKARKRLLRHFLSFIDALDTYKSEPLPTNLAPKTHILWATDGVHTSSHGAPPVREDDPREMKWLLLDRTDSGPNGWDTLVGSENVAIEVLSGVNHFSMMHGESAGEVAAFLRRVMELKLV